MFRTASLFAAAAFFLAAGCIPSTLPGLPFACDAGSQCSSGMACNLGLCVAPQPNSQLCDDALACESGFCVDGRCCDSACGASCDACDLAGEEGFCRVAPVQRSPSPACGVYTACDGASAGCPTTCTSDAGCTQGFNCGVRGSCQAKLETLVDDFNDRIIDRTLWIPIADPGASIAETNGRAELNAPPWIYGFAGYYSVRAYDPANSHATIALLSAGIAGSPSTSTQAAKFKLSDITGNDTVLFQLGGGQLGAWQVVGGTWTLLQSVGYDPVLHRYLQFRFDEADGGAVHWETSADGGTFAELASVPTAPWMQSTFVQFYAGNGTPGDDAGERALFDNLNVVAPSGNGGSDGGLGTDPDGSLCVDAQACASGFCVDGRCCESACAESCDVCNLPGVEGVCQLNPVGTEGSPSCGRYKCIGSMRTCPTTCTSDAGCVQGFNCGVLGSCQAKLETLVDDFNDGIIDSNLWSPSADPGTLLFERNGRAEVEIPPWAGQYAGYYSRGGYDPTQSSATIAVVSAGLGAVVLPSDQAVKFVLSDFSSAKSVMFQIHQGTVTANQVVDGVWTLYQTATYDPVNHRYLRFRFDGADGGTVRWETSADCDGFVELASAPTSPWMRSTFVQFYAGPNWVPPDDAGSTVFFDDLNLCVWASVDAGLDAGAQPDGGAGPFPGFPAGCGCAQGGAGFVGVSLFALIAARRRRDVRRTQSKNGIFIPT